jgi:hypothetical protein
MSDFSNYPAGSKAVCANTSASGESEDFPKNHLSEPRDGLGFPCPMRTGLLAGVGDANSCVIAAPADFFVIG